MARGTAPASEVAVRGVFAHGEPNVSEAHQGVHRAGNQPHRSPCHVGPKLPYAASKRLAKPCPPPTHMVTTP